MSNSYIFSILGAYNHDPTIFDGLQLPSNPFTTGYPDLFKDFPELDKATLISNLLLDCAQLSLLHTDTDFLKEEIRLWSRMHSLDWAQMYETMLYHYNPIWNKDGTVSETGSTAGTSGNTRTITENTGNIRTMDSEGTSGNTRETTNTNQSVNSGSDTINDSWTEDGSVVNSVNAYNSGSPTEHDRSVTDTEGTNARTISYGKTVTDNGEGTITDSGTTTETGRIEDTGSKTGTIDDAGNTTGSSSLQRVEQGNIGVTSTQALIQQQRDVIMNMYQYIIGQFKERFCVLIW